MRFLHFLLMLATAVLDVVAIVQILKTRQEGLKKAIWIVIIVGVPVLGLALWYFLGREEA